MECGGIILTNNTQSWHRGIWDNWCNEFERHLRQVFQQVFSAVQCSCSSLGDAGLPQTCFFFFSAPTCIALTWLWTPSSRGMAGLAIGCRWIRSSTEADNLLWVCQGSAELPRPGEAGGVPPVLKPAAISNSDTKAFPSLTFASPKDSSKRMT